MAVADCGDHVYTTIGQPADSFSDNWDFRVTGNTLKDYFSPGGFGSVWFAVHDANGDHAYGPYSASADTGFNVPLRAYWTKTAAGQLSVSVSIGNDRGTTTYCSGTYAVALEYW